MRPALALLTLLLHLLPVSAGRMLTVERFRLEGFEWDEADSVYVWDFSRASIADGDCLARYLSSGDSVFVAFTDRMMLKYALCGDSLMWTGYESRLTRMDGGTASNAVIARVPLRVGDSISSSYCFTGVYCRRMPMTERGSVESSVVARGSVILPEGDTVPNVTLLRTSRRFRTLTHDDSSDICLDSVPLQRVTSCRWFAEGIPYPIAKVTEVEIYDGDALAGQSGSCHVIRGNTEGGSVPEIHDTGRRTKTIPAQHSCAAGFLTDDMQASLCGSRIEVDFALTAPSHATVSVVDLAGRVMASVYGYYDAGWRHASVDASVIPPGEYLVVVDDGQGGNVKLTVRVR